MRLRHGRAGAARAALTLAALALAGCSGGPSRTADHAAPNLLVSGAGTARPANPDQPGSDPATWTLPMLAYQPTQEQEKTIGQAQLKLVRSCMSDFGIDWQPDPDLPQVGPRNMLDLRYGIHDAVLASKRGYQPDADQLERHDAALREQAAKSPQSPDAELVLSGTDLPPDVLAKAGPEAKGGVVAGRRIPDGGCFGQASRTLGSATHGVTPLVDRLTYQSYPESTKDPQVETVFAQWSACMSAKGFHYEAPMDANDDPRFKPGPQGVSQLEISTATADIACRDAYHVAEVWHTAEARIQQQYIEENRQALTGDRHDLDAVLKKAAEVLGQH